MTSDIVERITEYLSVGGLFNPELMPADKVRDIVICCRTEIESLRSRLAEVEADVKAADDLRRRWEGRAYAAEALLRSDTVGLPYWCEQRDAFLAREQK